LLLIAVGLILFSSLNRVSALEASNIDITPTGGNSGWVLRIDISVNNSFTLSLDDLAAMPKTIVQAELSCNGRYLTSGAWGGVKLGVLLEKVGFDEPTANLQFYAADGYTTTFSYSDATPEDVIIAYELGGSSLQEKLRLVIPGTNGEAWIGLITAITINGPSPTYPSSPNPHAASIVPDRSPTLQPSPTPKPSPTPELRDQSTPQPTDPPPANQQVQQQDSSSSNTQTDYDQLALIAIIIVATVAIGFLLYRRRK
jgi:DMSO/TMAO reductase YedYZ molybdopterin-dependent catalytic subunit